SFAKVILLILLLVCFSDYLLHTVAERDIFAQETCHLLLSPPLYHSSRQFVTLNLNNEALRWLCETENNNISINDIGQTDRSALQKYWNRPVELEDLSLFQLYSKY